MPSSAESDKSSPLSWLLAILALVITGAATYEIVQMMPVKIFQVSPSPTPALSESERLKNPDHIFNLVATGQVLVSGPSAITVKQGDSIRVNIKAQGKDEIHVILDGYGINTEAHHTDDTPGGFSFIADKTGEFAFWSYTESGTNSTQSQHTKLGTISVKK